MYTKFFKFQLMLAVGFSLLYAEDNSQNSVKGIVSSKEKGIPLQGANVELVGSNNQQYGATTDIEGGFSIDGCLLYTSDAADE